MQQNYVGFYYPYIHFRNDSWLKLSALYWDRIARIVPDQEIPRDSEIVLRLKGDLDFIEDHSPRVEFATLTDSFLDLIKRHERKLTKKYRVNTDDSELTDLYIGKMSYQLRSALLETGLAVGSGYDYEKLRMKPRLADVYMMALAKEMGARRQYFPITDNTREHVAMAGHTVKELAQVLLGEDEINLSNPNRSAHNLEHLMANMAIESILPVNIEEVPIQKIIEIRKRYGSEIRAFQNHFHSIVTDASWILKVEDGRALQTQLELLYEQNLKKELLEFKDNLKMWGIESIKSSMNIQITLPGLFSGGLLAALKLDPIMATVGGVALTVASIVSDATNKRKNILRSSPAAYLFHIEKSLTPPNMAVHLLRRYGR